MRADTIIFHGGCLDGFGAAWVASRRFPGAELVPARHGDSPPDVSGRHVLVLDFSYPRPVLLAMAREAASLRLLDHHVTAHQALGDLPYCEFDMNRSGAGLAWDVLTDGQPRPWLVDDIEDGDLWTWARDGSKAVRAALNALPATLEAWNQAVTRGREALLTEGQAILAYQARLVDRVATEAHRATIAGHDVPVVNSPVLQSELGNLLAEGEPFAAVYNDTADGGRAYSLRSCPGGVDVSEIAKRYGGGGHPRAAGFLLGPGQVP